MSRKRMRLFRQHELSFDLKVPAPRGDSGSGLATSDRDRVLALRHDDVSLVGNHTQVALVEVEVESLTCAGVQMDSLEST